MNDESEKPDIPPQRNKPGPQTGHWVDIVKPAIVIGRDKTPVPPDEVEHMASLGCPDREIATYFAVKEDTLRRHFADYLVKGRQRLKTSLRQAQIRIALEGNAVMLIWLGKNILQQNDYGTASADHAPLPWSDDVDTVDATIEDLDAAESAPTTDS